MLYSCYINTAEWAPHRHNWLLSAALRFTSVPSRPCRGAGMEQCALVHTHNTSVGHSAAQHCCSLCQTTVSCGNNSSNQQRHCIMAVSGTEAKPPPTLAGCIGPGGQLSRGRQQPRAINDTQRTFYRCTIAITANLAHTACAWDVNKLKFQSSQPRPCSHIGLGEGSM